MSSLIIDNNVIFPPKQRRANMLLFGKLLIIGNQLLTLGLGSLWGHEKALCGVPLPQLQTPNQ